MCLSEPRNDEASEQQQRQQHETSAHEARKADTKHWRRCRSLLAASRCAQSVECRTSWRTHVCVASRDSSEIIARRELQTEAKNHHSLSFFLTRATETEACVFVIDLTARVRSRCICFVAGRPAPSPPRHTAPLASAVGAFLSEQRQQQRRQQRRPFKPV